MPHKYRIADLKSAAFLNKGRTGSIPVRGTNRTRIFTAPFPTMPMPSNVSSSRALNGRQTAGSSSWLRILAAAGAVVFVCLLCFYPVTATDIWLQIKIGQMILADGAIPKTVLFTFTWARDNPFHMHEWLPSILFYGVDVLSGHVGLMMLQGALGLLLFVACMKLALRLSGSVGVSLFLSVLALLVENFRYELRPELFALLFLVWLLDILTRYREQANWRVLLWTLPLALVWANTHGSFLLGPVVACIFAAGEGAEQLRGGLSPAHWRSGVRVALPYVLAALGMALVSLLNPMGLELWVFALNLKGSAVTRMFINEWLPTLGQFTGQLAFWIFIATLALCIAAMMAGWRKLRVTDLLLLGAFTYVAFQHVRFVGLFGFIALVVVARLAGVWSARARSERGILVVCVACAALGIGLLVKFGNLQMAYPYDAPSTNFTKPMLEVFAQPDVKGNVINTYDLGSELVYRAYPRLRPLIDPRIDSYGDDYFLLYQRLLSDENLLNEFVADYDVRYMLLLWFDFDRIKGMPSIQKGWKQRFGDQKMVLLERIGPAIHPPAPDALLTKP